MRAPRSARMVAFAAAFALLACAPQARAQSRLNTTWTAVMTGAPTATDFQAGRVVVGYVTANVLACARPSCRVQIFSTNANASNMRWVVSTGTPALALCSNTLPTTQATATTMVTVTGPQSIRVYICRQLSWTATPPGAYASAVTIRLRNN